MTTNADTYKAAASQARGVADRSVEAWKRSAKTVAEQATAATKLPTVDLVQPIERYFEYIQRSVDVSRDLAIKWAESLNSLSGMVREQAEKIGSVVVEQADNVGNAVVKQAEKAEHFVDEKADQAEKAAHERQAEQEQAEKEQARQARAAERAEAKAAHEKAREQYENLTKAELADKLAERDLPKSGNVDELIERLVSADSE